MTHAPLPYDFISTLDEAKRGDPTARELLFRRIYPRVEGMVHAALKRDLRTTRPWLAARFSTGDVVQDVFRNLLEDLSRFHGDDEDALCCYVSMIVRNRLLDAIRFHEAARRDGRRTASASAEVLGESSNPGPGTSVASLELVNRLRDMLSDLPEQEQLLLRGRLEQATGFQELADSLGYSSKWAARRAFYAAQATLVIRMRQASEDFQ